VRCFSEEKVWSAVSVGKYAVWVIVLVPLSIKLTQPLIKLTLLAIALAPCRHQLHSHRTAFNRTQKQKENLQSDSTKQSFNN
jgi:hypothetical protein